MSCAKFRVLRCHFLLGFRSLQDKGIRDASSAVTLNLFDCDTTCDM